MIVADYIRNGRIDGCRIYLDDGRFYTGFNTSLLIRTNRSNSMSSAIFHIELRVQNVETMDHVEAIGKSLQRAATMIAADAMLILGDSCTPEIEAYGEDFAQGRYPVTLRQPGDDEPGSEEEAQP
jgi:hypothetical protein